MWKMRIFTAVTVLLSLMLFTLPAFAAEGQRPFPETNVVEKPASAQEDDNINAQQQNVQNELSELLQKAEAGDTAAQNKLGVYYYTKDNNYTEAVKWYSKAAASGLAKAQYNMGQLYREGKGVPQSYKEAAKWYKKAADQGYTEAQYNLGVMYYRGNGVTLDYPEAIKWYRKAAEQGAANAQNYLGFMYENGYGVNRNKNKAIFWYKKAADLGSDNAKNNLERISNFEDGYEFTIQRSREWFIKPIAAVEVELKEECLDNNTHKNSGRFFKKLDAHGISVVKGYAGGEISCKTGSGILLSPPYEYDFNRWVINRTVLRLGGTIIEYSPNSNPITFKVQRSNVGHIVIMLDAKQPEKSKYIAASLRFPNVPRFLQIHPKVRNKTILQLFNEVYGQMLVPKGIDMFTNAASLLDIERSDTFWGLVNQMVRNDEAAFRSR